MPDYVAGSTAKPEVGVFTQTHSARRPVPWGRIAANEHVYMKWSGGPIVARARVQGFRQLENCSPAELRATTAGFALYDLSEYWESRPARCFALTIYLESEEWLDPPWEPVARAYGESWVVLETEEKRRAWISPARLDFSDRPPLHQKGRSRSLSKSRRFQVFRRDSFTCTYCGRRAPHVPLHVDHVIPWSKGGSNELSNLATACAECNLGKGASLL